MTSQERQIEREKRHEEMKTWAQSQGIDWTKLHPNEGNRPRLGK